MFKQFLVFALLLWGVEITAKALSVDQVKSKPIIVGCLLVLIAVVLVWGPIQITK